MTAQEAGAIPIMAGVITALLMGCGAVGTPIPPERVGVNATIERQKTLDALEEKRRKDAAGVESTEPDPDSTLQGQDVNPPPLQPVGTR